MLGSVLQSSDLRQGLLAHPFPYAVLPRPVVLETIILIQVEIVDLQFTFFRLASQSLKERATDTGNIDG